MPKQNLGNEIYEGAAVGGRAMSLISAVTASVISIGFIAFGIYLIVHHPVYTEGPVTGTLTVLPNACVATITNGNSSSSCTFDVKYTTKDGVNLTKGMTKKGSYTNGQTVDVYYNPNNHSDIMIENNDNTTIFGWIMIIIAVIVVIGAWLWVWLTNKYKFLAAAEGASTAVNMFRGVNTPSNYGGGYGSITRY